MSRLTEYRKDLKRYEYKQDERGYCFIQEGQLVKKLGKLEDLEEQIGCPLEVIIRALKDGIYNKRGFHYKVILYEDVLCAYPIDVYDESWELSNYKKTWWLKEDRSE